MIKIKKIVSFDDVTIKREEEKERRLKNAQRNNIIKIVLFSILVICVLIMIII